MPKLIQPIAELPERRMNGLVPIVDHPFFVVTPPYTRISAGITVLHLLCHYFNIRGDKAFILHYPPEEDPRGMLPSYAKLQITGQHPAGMIAPLLTQDVVEFYDKERISPILIYPEVFDNVFAAPIFGRYILNYPGLLSPHYQDEADLTFAYTEILAKSVLCKQTLYMCTADLSYWNTNGAARKRRGSCYYAGKRQSILGRQLREVPDGSVEILPKTLMPRDRVRELFWQSEAFYCFEDSALATEAILCGCPVIWVPNEDFNGVPLATAELGWDGACLVGEPDGFARAQRTTVNYDMAVRASFETAMDSISIIASKLKDIARQKGYCGTIQPIRKAHLVYFQGVDTFTFGNRIESPVSLPEPISMNDPDRSLEVATVARLEEEIHSILASTSWKLSAPVRWVGGFIKSVRNQMNKRSVAKSSNL